MSLLDRLFGWLPRLLRLRPAAPRPPRLPLDAAWRPTVEAPASPPEEAVVEPAFGAAAGQGPVIEAREAIALASVETPVVVAAETAAPQTFEPDLPEPDLPEDEDVFEEEEFATDLDDEEVSDDETSDLDVRLHAQLLATPGLRSAAEREAVSGEHRIGLSDPGGPGTLAEALIRLEREGALTCELGEDEAGSPVLVYRPKADATVH